jgi:hypothetical protein
MRTIIGSAGRPAGRRPFLTLAALSVCFLWPIGAGAAPPISASLAWGVVGQNEYGTIKGRLVWDGDNIPPVKVLEEKGKAEKDPNVCAKDKPILSRELRVDPETKGVSFAFAYLVKPNGANPQAVKDLVVKNPTVELDQQNCEFLPYLVPMHQDQVLVVKASDPGINHNVRLNAFANAGLNQNLAPGGQLQLKLVPERLPIKLNCDIHPWMKSYVMVFDHPFFTTTGKDGSFEIKGVPAGDQKLVIWQENVGYVNPGFGKGMPVTVKGGEVVDVGVVKLEPGKVKG